MTLPDFRNLGVVLRILILSEFANLVALFAYAPDEFRRSYGVGGTGLLFEVTLLGTVLVLFVFSPSLRSIPYRAGVATVLAVVAIMAAGVDTGVRALLDAGEAAGGLKASIIAAVLGAVILAYFNWRQRALSPALAESRLIALQARIRPHFLFNSINAAISVVRENPKRAEEVLLDMSDLFRVVLAEPRPLVPLENELRVARAYLDIEQVRLGDRLSVRWECGDVPLDALVPVLLLQPLVENAVWHGIEPAPLGGEIMVRITCRNKTMTIEVSNPVAASTHSKSAGNQIALANIEERLALHFDAEAQLRVVEKDGQFRVRIHLPLTLAASTAVRQNSRRNGVI